MRLEPQRQRINPFYFFFLIVCCWRRWRRAADNGDTKRNSGQMWLQNKSPRKSETESEDVSESGLRPEADTVTWSLRTIR